MKCIKKDGNIRRVKNEVAEKLIETGEYQYCSKKEWKEQVRTSE